LTEFFKHFPAVLTVAIIGRIVWIYRVYNNEGTLIKYNGRNLAEDLNNDTNSQDTSDQQEASDKQKLIDVEKTKQKLAPCSSTAT
jgi:hypothetical protein